MSLMEGPDGERFMVSLGRASNGVMEYISTWLKSMEESNELPSMVDKMIVILKGGGVGHYSFS